jgi:hypothetical protein
MPSKLLNGLPGAPHKPSKLSSFFSAASAVSDEVATHSDSTSMFSLWAACCSESVVAWWERKSALKSPKIPIRTASLTGLIVLDDTRRTSGSEWHQG